jgi:hypothetical protein
VCMLMAYEVWSKNKKAEGMPLLQNEANEL